MDEGMSSQEPEESLERGRVVLTVGKEIGVCLGVREEVGAPGRRWEKHTKGEETGGFDASASWHLRTGPRASDAGYRTPAKRVGPRPAGVQVQLRVAGKENHLPRSDERLA